MSSSALNGKQILLTRAAHQNIELEQLVLKRSAIPLLFPCLEIQQLDESITSGLHMLQQCSDVLFTSTNAVQCLARFLQADTNMATILDGKRIAAVGNQTAAALQHYGISIDLLPDIASQDGLLTTYRHAGLPEQGLLFFRAEEGREMLTEELGRLGVKVIMVPVYRTICPRADTSEITTMLKADAIDAVLLGSPRAARHYRSRINNLELANRPVIAVISEKLAQAAKSEGLDVQVVAKSASFDSMLDALSEFFEFTNTKEV